MSSARFLQIGILILFSSSAMAFEGDEHRAISGHALRIAVDFQCQNKPPKCVTLKKEVQKLQSAENDAMTYGRINEVVDFMHYPEQIFKPNPDPESKRLKDPEELLNPHVRQLLDKRSKTLVLFDYLSASSHNERHFQEDLMKSLDGLHLAAVNHARAGDIFNALVTNALSDHFLNDFFAPGHITTQRENSHDLVALAMHDWSNRAGTCFKIKNWDELGEILKFIEDRPTLYEGLFEEIDARDYDFANQNLKMCDNEADFDVASLDSKSLQEKIIRNLTNSHDEIFLKGDGSLIRNPKQVLFMLLVQVRSISEVIAEYIGCENSGACATHENSTTLYQWEDSYWNKDIEPPTAKIRYGQYDIKKVHEEEPVYIFLKRPKHAYPGVADNAFLLSLGGQTLPHEPARFETQIELFPMKVGSAMKSWRDKMVQRPSSDCRIIKGQLCNIGIAFGITYFRGPDVESTGAQLRFVKVFPKISGQISLYARRGKYDGANVDSWRNAYGFRYDHGFSLHSFYIGYQRDYGFSSNGTFRRQNAAVFGWNFTFPTSRLLRFFGGYK